MTMNDEEFKSICQNKFDFGDCLDDCIKYYNKDTGKIADVDPESGQKVNIPEDKKHLFEMLKSAAKTETGQNILNELDNDTKIQVVTDKNLAKDSYFHTEEKHLIGIPTSNNILSDTAKFMGALSLELTAQKGDSAQSQEENVVRRVKSCFEADVVEAKIVYEMADQYQSKAGKDADMSSFAKMFDKGVLTLAGLYGAYLLNNSPEKAHDNLLDTLIEKNEGKVEQWFHNNRAQIPANYQTSAQLHESLLSKHSQDRQDKVVQTMNRESEGQSVTSNDKGEQKLSFSQALGSSIISPSLYDKNLLMGLPEFQKTSKEMVLDAVKNYRAKPIERRNASNPVVVVFLLNESGIMSNQSNSSQKEATAKENDKKSPLKSHSEEIILDTLIQKGNLNAEQENKLLAIATELEQNRLKGNNSKSAEKFIDKIIEGNFLSDAQKDIALDASIKAEKIELGISKLKNTFNSQKPVEQSTEKTSQRDVASKVYSPSLNNQKGR